MDVAVVGAGIHGASSARNLAERGHRVTLFEQFEPGHANGSSHGRSRIVRRAYPDPLYTEFMLEAYPLWTELEQACGRKLLNEVGLLYFGSEDSDDLDATRRNLEDLNVPFELVGPTRIVDFFPALRLIKGEIGIFTPEAGWVEADTALAETLRLAKESGCRLLNRKASPNDLRAYDAAIVCPGPWVKDWLPEAPVKISQQTVVYLRGGHQGPVWIEDGPDLMYGFPSDGVSFKVAAHRHGPQTDPGTLQRDPRQEDLDLARHLARRRFGIEAPGVIEAQACLYTNTPTEDFLFARLDEHTFLVSACSGHGFKFGPWVGTVMADVVEGKRQLPSFPQATSDKRSVDR
jgi:glycine/D-amino acid oxidase-like deaminating enzyme